MNTKIENLITKVVRGLYSKPRLKPGVTIDRRGRRVEIEVDVSPWNPGLLIGERGSMKFALELLIGYAFDLDGERDVNIHVASTKKKEIERTVPGAADPKKVRPIAEAIAILFDGDFEVDSGSKSVMVHFTLPREIAHDVKPPLSKVIRACGKAGGFSALPYVHAKR
jgi:predicted RNA-binding protein YlqC (UPF0109 family)